MMIERKPVYFSDELRKSGREPVGEMVRDDRNVFRLRRVHAITAGSATAGPIRYGERNTFIQRARKQRGFSSARMTGHDDFFSIHIIPARQIIDAARESPRPGGEVAPVLIGVCDEDAFASVL